MLDKNKVYAVVGASKNKNKYGYKVLEELKEAGFQVIPVNLKENEILGLKAYQNLSAVDSKIDVVVFVVPPEVTENILKEVKRLKINQVWMQPGSESDKAVQYCQDNNIKCIHDICVIIENKRNI